jgi:hypothetical protein
MPFSHIYIRQSESNVGRFYVGLTDDLQARLQKHTTAACRIRQSSARGTSRPPSPVPTASALMNLSVTSKPLLAVRLPKSGFDQPSLRAATGKRVLSWIFPRFGWQHPATR